MIIDIVKSNFKIIIFGFVFTFFSCIGQSFFIGLFNSSIRDELNITHGEFGAIYGIATLCSSLTLIWLGKKIDDLKLVNYSFLVVVFLSIAALFFSFVSGLIFLGVFILLTFFLTGIFILLSDSSELLELLFIEFIDTLLVLLLFAVLILRIYLTFFFLYNLSIIFYNDSICYSI